MSSPPVAMRANGRREDPNFHNEEYLFRRIPTTLWDDPAEELDVDAVQLPDISVERSKYAHAEWARFDVLNDRYYDVWGIVAVQVQDIPPELWREGVFHFVFRVNHCPDDRNYPHAEIRAYENEVHVDQPGKIPEDVDLAWRERLLRKLQTIIKPHQIVRIRETAPVSHKLEPHVVVS
ncbi:MAG: hypothetical protein EXR98_24220 [Gemmataceae bacterium]|nr:hypothetical protein [Gemmataceae bacterium]